MKKTFFVTGCVVLLSLLMVVMGCDKDNSNPSTPSTPDNQYTVGTISFDIQSAFYYVYTEDAVKETAIGFISSGSVSSPIKAMVLEFENQNGIPTGTFHFSETIEGAIWMNSDVTITVASGEINISQSGTTYTITIDNNAVLEDNQSFLLTYSGIIELSDSELPTPTNNYFSLGTTDYNIAYSGYQTEEYEGEFFTSILFMDESFDNALYIACSGSSTIPTGAFTLSSSNYQFMCGLIIGDDEYTLTSGTANISKSGNNYTVNVTGEALDLFGETVSVTCHYEGALTEITLKGMFSFLK